jgi:hypothetical protein
MLASHSHLRLTRLIGYTAFWMLDFTIDARLVDAQFHMSVEYIKHVWFADHVERKQQEKQRQHSRLIRVLNHLFYINKGRDIAITNIIGHYGH